MTFDAAWLMERRIRMVHNKLQTSDGTWYCELCQDHGDIQWPCRTIQALENRDDAWRRQ